MSEQETAPPPGFYDDGSGRQRWWDGSQWTEHRQGVPAPLATEPPEDSGISGTAVAGYVLAALIPFVGFFVGIALIARRDRHGAPVVLVSVLAFFVYLALLSQ